MILRGIDRLEMIRLSYFQTIRGLNGAGLLDRKEQVSKHRDLHRWVRVALRYVRRGRTNLRVRDLWTIESLTHPGLPLSSRFAWKSGANSRQHIRGSSMNQMAAIWLSSRAPRCERQAATEASHSGLISPRLPGASAHHALPEPASASLAVLRMASASPAAVAGSGSRNCGSKLDCRRVKAPRPQS